MSEDDVEVTGEVVDRTGEVTGTAARQLTPQVKANGKGRTLTQEPREKGKGFTMIPKTKGGWGK